MQRYKELGGGGAAGGESIPFEIDSHITEIDTGKAYFESLEGTALPMFRVNARVAKLLSDFLLRGGIALKKAA